MEGGWRRGWKRKWKKYVMSLLFRNTQIKIQVQKLCLFYKPKWKFWNYYYAGETLSHSPSQPPSTYTGEKLVPLKWNEKGNFSITKLFLCFVCYILEEEKLGGRKRKNGLIIIITTIQISPLSSHFSGKFHQFTGRLIVLMGAAIFKLQKKLKFVF